MLFGLHPATRLAHWLLSQSLTFTQALWQGVIFRPLHWPSVAIELFTVSQGLALALAAVALTWGLLQSMWPVAGLGWTWTPGQVVGRAVTAAILSGMTVPVMRWLLTVNNAVVVQLVGGVPGPAPGSMGFSITSPLLAAVMVVLTLGLLVYLGLLYALRAIEIFVLAALAPWVAVGWMATGNPGPMRRLWVEMTVAIFVQSVHAITFWLFMHWVWSQTGVWGGWEAVGALWYMTKIPGQLRHLLGAGTRGGMWRWT